MMLQLRPRQFGFLLICCLSLSQVGSAAAADRVAVGVNCKTNTNGETREKPFAINFNMQTSHWSVSEPGNTSEVFKTKNGPFVTVANTTSLKTNAGVVAADMRGFNPSTATEGAHGNDGHAIETARTFEWTVSIVTR